MKPQSAKAKSRRLQNLISQRIREKFNLSESDCKPALMGESGTDVKLSSSARAAFGFAVEAKYQERLNIWAALEQAERNSDGLTPVVCFKRNRSEVYVCLKFEDFMELL